MSSSRRSVSAGPLALTSGATGTAPVSLTSAPARRDDRSGATLVNRRCSVCRSPQRPAIDLELGSTSRVKALAGRYGVTESALNRHKRNHLRPALERAAVKRENASASAVLDRFESLYDVGWDALQQAKNPRDQAALMREVRGVLDSVARVTGEFKSDAAGNDNRRLTFVIEKLESLDASALAALAQGYLGKRAS